MSSGGEGVRANPAAEGVRAELREAAERWIERGRFMAVNPMAIRELLAERDALAEQVARVEALHQRIDKAIYARGEETGSMARCEHDNHGWPCPTAAALNEGNPDA